MMGSGVGQDHHAHDGSNAFFQNLAVSKEDFFVVDFGNDVIAGSSKFTTIFFFFFVYSYLEYFGGCE
jgi:hypothetical protein